MKQFFPVVWWCATALLLALLFVSLGYSFVDALLTGSLFLPGMLALRYFVPQLSFEDRPKGILDTVYLLLAILVIEYFSLTLGYRLVFETELKEPPGLLFNPLFILLLLAAFTLPEIALERYLERRRPYDSEIHFISDRRKIGLDPADILYIESNDDEVWVHTADGEAFRTKTGISQWEAQLDRRFLRIHRSYIVNTLRIEEYRPAQIKIGGRQIGISRKYKEAVRRRLDETV